LDTETERILHTAHQVSVGFYKLNNFIVLPKSSKALGTNLVIFPDLNYKSISRFWSKTTKIDIYTDPFTIDPKLRSDFKNLLANYKPETPNYLHTKTIWEKAEKEILTTIYDLLPSKKNLLKEIKIYPTKTGTNCSFSLTASEGHMYIYLRDDQGIHAIIEAIITSLTRNDIYQKLGGVWQESEIITDFLVTQTKLAKVLQKYESKEKYIPTIKGTRVKDVGNLQKLSDEYYKKLNVPNFDKPFNLNGLTPEVNNKPILNLTPKEKQVMYLLIKNSNNIISFDQISDIIFNTDDNFSLFALAKFIQRLREKLEKNGVSGSFIQTLRSKGYLLKN
jgi:hypothetical protein